MFDDLLPEFLRNFVASSIGYIGLVLLAVWGGTVNYISRLKQNEEIKFSFVELIGEWTISGFAGLLTAYICFELELSWQMTAFFTGIAGHLGGRAIFMFELYFKSKVGRFFPGIGISKKNED